MISDHVVRLLCEQNILRAEDVELCRYGLTLLCSSVIQLFVILIISIFIRNLFETICFFIAFIPLRLYVGGYHAETRKKCFLTSLTIYLIFTVILYWSEPSLYLFWSRLLSLISFCVVYIFAPIIHKNRNVKVEEKIYFRKISIVICFLETLFVLIFTAIIPKNIDVMAFSLGQFTVVFSMLVAMLKNKLCYED